MSEILIGATDVPPDEFWRCSGHVTLLDHAVRALRRVRSPQRLNHIMEALTCELDFRHFAIIEHGDLRLGMPQIVCFENYPPIWRDRFIEDQLYLHDPVLRACLTTGLGFEWSDVPRMLRCLTGTQRRILACARREGLGLGYSVPYNVPGERRGSCSFALKFGRDMPRANLLPASIIGGFAFHAARRLLRPGPRLSAVELTPRQIDCLILAAQGKSDSVIGQLLGLSKNTVTSYMTAARQRFGVATREQLIVVALFDGVIGFTDILTRH